MSIYEHLKGAPQVQIVKSFAALVVAGTNMLRRNRVLLVSSLGLALISMVIFGLLFASNGSPKLALGVVDLDHSPAAETVLSALRRSDSLTISTGTKGGELRALRNGHRDAVSVLEAGFGPA